MYVISSFEHSSYLELALKELEDLGIKKEKILAVPLNPNLSQTTFHDTINRSDGLSILDGAAILGTFFSVFGVIYGFVLMWGPIIWGLIGLFVGGLIGFALDLFINRRKLDKKRLNNGKSSEVILIIDCYDNLENQIKEILVRNDAIGIGSFRNK